MHAPSSLILYLLHFILSLNSPLSLHVKPYYIHIIVIKILDLPSLITSNKASLINISNNIRHLLFFSY